MELRDICKKYSGICVLDNINLQLKKGEILGLVGPNGSGKSTIIKCCTGAVVPDSGKIIIDKKEYNQILPEFAKKEGISVVYQEFNNVPELSVAENMFLGYPIRKGIFIDKKKMEEETKKIFEELHVNINPKELIKNLKVGHKQVVEIAKAIRSDARILILDEPSAALSTGEVEKMFKTIKKLNNEGVSIIYISHRLDEIMNFTDRVMVIRDGKYIDTVNTKDITKEKLINKMVGYDIAKQFPEKTVKIKSEEPILRLEKVSGNGDIDISFDVHSGEIVGFGGLVGAGRTELAEMIFGIKEKDSGKIFFEGKEINIKKPSEAVKMGIALISEDRKNAGVVLPMSIKNNILLPSYKKISSFYIINEEKETKTTRFYQDKLLIKSNSIDQPVTELSGGNQQKVVIGKWLFANSKLLIFDEPTRGIDIGARYEIYKLINELAKEGKAIIMISSDNEELMGMSDRILVFSEHKIVAELKREEFNQNKIMAYASGYNYSEV